MLSASDALRPGARRKRPLSLQLLYHSYIMQRIEAYKNSIPRDELMRIGDEARLELERGTEGQFFLTEVLAADIVDGFLKKRLRLPTFKKWQKEFLPLREAQRQPTRWGLDAACPVVRLLNRLEPGDRAAVVGPGGAPCVYLLSAHDAHVTFLANEIGLIDRVEATVSSEALGEGFEALFVQWGWLPEPELPFDLVVLDVEALVHVEAPVRCDLVRGLQARSGATAVHVLLGTGNGGLAPEAFFGLYEGWRHESAPRGSGERFDGVILSRTADAAEDGLPRAPAERKG